MNPENKETNIQVVKQAIDYGAKMHTALKDSINSFNKQEREELIKYVNLKKVDAIMVQDFEKASNLRDIENRMSENQ